MARVENRSYITLLRFKRPPALNRADWVALAVMLFLLGAVFYPVFAKRSANKYKNYCHANLRQISRSLLAYAQDYDERLPVAASLSDGVGGVAVRRNWAISVVNPNGSYSPGLLERYIEHNMFFQHPGSTDTDARLIHLTYMYNDLAAASRLSDFAKPADTVIVVDGEELLDNVGHAWIPRSEAATNGATYNAQGRCDAGKGAFVTEFATTRHSGGANYAFADGHVKWFAPSKIYFPPRASNSPASRDASNGTVLGPTPGERMTWNGRAWAGTFHLR